jgi:hypothetical protein
MRGRETGLLRRLKGTGQLHQAPGGPAQIDWLNSAAHDEQATPFHVLISDRSQLGWPHFLIRVWIGDEGCIDQQLIRREAVG